MIKILLKSLLWVSGPIALLVITYVHTDVAREIVAPNVVSFNVPGNVYRRYATGSYVIHNEKNFIITNRHVCLGGLLINKQLGRKERLLSVNGHDVKVISISKVHDMCLLESDRKTGLKVAKETPDLLDHVILVGHPRGIDLTIRRGRLISHDHSVRLPTPGLNGGMTVYESYRITATAYPGNSGSPVTNSSGELIGLLFAGSPAYPHEPFVVPLKFVRQFLNDLK